MTDKIKRLKFRIVFTGEYDADPQHYDTDDVHRMCEIDKAHIEDDPFLFLQTFDFEGEVVVEPVEDASK